MNYPAASCGVSSSVLARHSVRGTPAPYWIREESSRAFTGFLRYDELAASGGVSTLNGMNLGFASFEPFTKQYRLFNGNVQCLEMGFGSFERTFEGQQLLKIREL